MFNLFLWHKKCIFIKVPPRLDLDHFHLSFLLKALSASDTLRQSVPDLPSIGGGVLESRLPYSQFFCSTKSGPTQKHGTTSFCSVLSCLPHQTHPNGTSSSCITKCFIKMDMVSHLKCRKDYQAYVDVCFREFGDRVLHWTTFNEANVYSLGGYDLGFTPPNRCSSPFGVLNCTHGNSSHEPYLVAHHLLLAHASAVRLYRKKYKVNVNLFHGLRFNYKKFHAFGRGKLFSFS